ncbi:hypothetical protein FR838_18510 [Acinetobacter pittii]|uniref:hypothetical protein n=1 Tax=Acinetobacter pittii TaxID=48296 RepID=UPI0011BBF843|nr:hypothetical protein [Acinetobacter pittii]QEA26381.1 hypothetical protein FR838_18510 [Acinetobacter pittii]
MGEAKRRGTKEERTAQAIARNEATKTEAKKALIVNPKNPHSRGKAIGFNRLSVGLAIALATMGTSAIEVGKYED